LIILHENRTALEAWVPPKCGDQPHLQDDLGIYIPDFRYFSGLSRSRRINVFGSTFRSEAVEAREVPSVLMLSTVSFLIGAALARRFNFIVLIPAVAIVLTLAVGIDVANPPTAWSIVAMAAATATSMQIGYLLGLSIRDVLAAGASSRSAPSSSARHTAR